MGDLLPSLNSNIEFFTFNATSGIGSVGFDIEPIRPNSLPFPGKHLKGSIDRSHCYRLLLYWCSTGLFCKYQEICPCVGGG